jgi:hypothetical protein
VWAADHRAARISGRFSGCRPAGVLPVKRRGANIRPGWLVCAALAVAAVAGLLVAGSRSLMVRQFDLRVPNQDAVAVLHPSQTVCQGPIASPGQTSGVGIWGGSALGVAVVGIDVRDARTQMHLASGQIEATASQGYVAKLSRPLPPDRPLTICVTGILNTFVLAGGPAAAPHVTMTGPKRGLQFSLALEKRSSILGALSTAFSRASLWRPSWVGSWTFWLLAFALLGTFGLAVVTVVSADSDDPRGDDDPGRDRPVSESGEDRPQPVA